MTPPLLADAAPDVASFGNTYGPYAFGVASLLLIWYFIVRPELVRSRVDLDKVQVITAAQKATAELLEKIVERLERATEQIERHTGVRE